MDDDTWTLADEMAEQRAELDAEMAIERYYENAGWAEAEAQREYEDRMGVVQFEDAFAEALRQGA